MNKTVMKKTAGAIFALGILTVLPAHAYTATGMLAPLQRSSSAAIKADWDDYHWHNRWRSHYRWGSNGGGWGWHNRWRSHYRWGSYGGGWGWHNRWRSHYRWGSGHGW